MAWSELESVREHRERAAEFVRRGSVDLLDGALKDADRECESPIEAIFKMWWRALDMLDVLLVRQLNLETQHSQTINGHLYRLDFSIIPLDVELWHKAYEAGVRYQSIGIELDGHDFHERTKDQVAYRNQRDRDFQAQGWRILHFSGTELFRDPAAVVIEAAGAATESLNSMTVRYSMRQMLGNRAEAVAQNKETAPSEDSGL